LYVIQTILLGSCEMEITRSDPGQIATLGGLLSDVSIEVTPREPSVAEKLPRYFPPGTATHVTFLPDDNLTASQDTCIALCRAGYIPVPHITARNFAKLAQLESHLARLCGEAEVTRVLLIAGDVDRPKGEFGESLDVLRTGVLAKYGVRTCLLAGHPEEHPKVAGDIMDAALDQKIAVCREQGIAPEIVTQFSFEGDAIVNWLAHIRARHVDVPVRIGVSGPAGTATLLKFGMRCGIGNSLRALRRNAAGIGKLLGDTTPDELLSEIAAGLAHCELGPITGLHLYMFGGTRKSAEWLHCARNNLGAAAHPTASAV
jgi:methylenetetrahydrofolate reductase (NADPH)